MRGRHKAFATFLADDRDVRWFTGLRESGHDAPVSNDGLNDHIDQDADDG